MSRVVLVDAALEARARGHHLQLNLGLARRIDPDRCIVVGHRSVGRIPELGGVAALGGFRTSPYDLEDQARLGGFGRLLQSAAYRDNTRLPPAVRAGLQAFLKRRRAQGRRAVDASEPPQASAAPSPYAQELAGICARLDLGPQDHLVFTSLDAAMGRAILALWGGRDTTRTPNLHLRVIYGEVPDIRSSDDVAAALARGELGSRARLYSETRAHARALERELGCKVEPVPYPADALTPPAAAEDGRMLTISYFGEARKEKGFDLLEPVVRSFMQRRPDLAPRIRWRFHAGGASVEATAARDRLRRSGPGVAGDLEYVFGVMSQRHYRQALSEADIILAPQDPVVYALRGSGVAHEAVAAGRPLVCLEGSTLATEFEGAIAAARDVDGLADALAAIVSAPEPWFERARTGARLFQQRLDGCALLKRTAES